MTPGQSLRCLTTGRIFTVVKKTKPKNGYLGGVKVIHLKGGYTEMSIRTELVTRYFEVIK